MPEPNVYWAGTPNYTSGNYGIEALFPHWTCGGFDASVSTLQDPAREASAHYVIEDDVVAQLVRESDSAWHCGNYYYNMRAISYELVGWPGNPPSYETLDTCARMMAQASRDYFDGAPLVLGENVMLHKWVRATDCPGETDIDWLVERANMYLNGGEEGSEMIYPVIVPEKGTVVHRLYNKNTGEHMWTIDPSEKDNMVSVGWIYEGEAWKCPDPEVAIYRLYNPYNGIHHFTDDFGEASDLNSGKWRCEAVPFFGATHGTPVYRLFNSHDKKYGLHHWTTDAAERDKLKAVGWTDEGVAFYAL